MSRRERKREMKREHKFERRAFKAERKAARRGYGGGSGCCAAPTPAPMNNGTYGGGNGSYGPQGYSYENQGAGAFNGAGPSYGLPRGLAPQEGGDGRRASFDVRDLNREESESESDAPPGYERGDWQRPPVNHRRSVEVLTEAKGHK